MDLTFKVEETCFNYRVGAICKHDNKILILQDEGEEYWYVPGGRVKMLENSEDALKRELAEELGVPIEVKRLIWSVENFFTLSERKFHEISFYYEVELHELPANGADQYILEEEGRRYLFMWVPVEELDAYNLQPAFIKDKVKDISIHTEHIVLQK
ncbi:NUDIX hydrolase [Bacillus nitratireducens]|uniref:NUDIX hydrolase n=1 Tax=Bacillus nitratireducens TaxID=2026193 RepID=UPI000BECF452|nr:NUDIX hydrolase [Bacillus nitratireducens]PEE19852.1 DNA mismatch repair protein MutT [Bacillus cereus]MED0905945.1 NUDIX hydrolase [Bacillus nitratireducens]PFH93471.1 DNA mismatch repair protein MutT [Bacillus cereus]PFM55199.1 DNA mismatch repair protein MutT [Bacillus cereus]PGS25708.1 DNA mismatch repair protein MutT [Bacillus cereus]